MLVTVIIFLREALEAALLLSVLLALSYQINLSRRWILFSFALGILGASITANYLGVISNALDGTGQEVFNATLLILMIILVYIVCISIALLNYGKSSPSDENNSTFLSYIIIVLVGIAITHEGSEISLYSFAAMHAESNRLTLFLGGMLGLGIGASLGVLIYYVVVNIRRSALSGVTVVILTLVAAGMSSQAVAYLMQSGWLNSQHALWDTSAYISERSVIGQLLYALLGYEATPAPIQVCLYLSVVIINITSVFFFMRLKKYS